MLPVRHDGDVEVPLGSMVSLLALLVLPAQAADLNVGANQTYSTIASALVDVDDGDVVLVHAPHVETGSNKRQSGAITVTGVGDASLIVLTSNADDGFFRAEKGASITIENVTISGGGTRRTLKMEDGGTMRLQGVTVRDGQHANGPSLEVKDGGSVVIADSTLIGGSGTNGGHIYATSGASLAVRRSTIDSGHALGDGGAILCNGGATCVVVDSVFTNNEADGFGGAIFATATAGLTVRGSHFEGNSTALEGAAIYMSDLAQAQVVRNAFCENIANDDGGGVLSRTASGVEVHNNLFFRNRSGDQGGGLRSRDGIAQWSHNVFWENLSYGGGHGMESESSTVSTTHDIVVRNEQVSDGDGRFAVWANNSTFSMKWSLLWDNQDGGFNHNLDTTNLEQPPALQGTVRECGFEFFKPAWRGNLFDAGSTDQLTADLDGSTADLGLYGGPESPEDAWVDADADGVPVLWDCDDDDEERAPDQEERCDGVDNDCDGDIDEDVASPPLWYLDEDGDGFGLNGSQPVSGCEAPGDNYASLDGDCDDDEESTNPLGVEQCDGVDNDCDGAVDDGVTDVTWYADADGDGYGVDGDTLQDCVQPDGYAVDGGDCDDTNSDVSPGAAEVVGNDVDEDCDGTAQQDDDTDPPDTDPPDTGLPETSDRVLPGDLDTGSLGPAVEAGCGCAAGGGPSGLWLVALGLLAVRRRR